jgi:hypothetical protein
MTIKELFDEIIAYSRKSFAKQRLIVFYNMTIDRIAQEHNFRRFFKLGSTISGSDSTNVYPLPLDARELVELRTSDDIRESADNLLSFSIRETSFIVDSSVVDSTVTMFPFYQLFPTELTLDNINSNLNSELPRNLKNAFILGMKIEADIDRFGTSQLFPLFQRELDKAFAKQDSKKSFAGNGKVRVDGATIQYF